MTASYSFRDSEYPSTINAKIKFIIKRGTMNKNVIKYMYEYTFPHSRLPY